MAKKTAAKPAAKQPETFGPPPAGGAPYGFATPGFGTEHVPPSVPLMNLRDGANAVIRFVKFPGPGGGPVLAVSIQAHRVSLQGKWRFFTVPDEGSPLSDAGHRPSWQWVAVVLPRASTDPFHNRMLGKPALVYLGKRAVDQLNQIVLPRLAQARKNLEDVDIGWRRIGKSVDSQHFFEILPKTKPLSPDEQKALQDLPDVMDVIKPLSKERLEAIAARVPLASAQSGGGDVVGEAVDPQATGFFGAS